MTTLSLRILHREAIRPQRRSPAAAVQGVLGKIGAAWRRRRSRNLLSQLDDYMLKDIGITPAEAQFEAHKPFWRE
jgi:uncharacterized protein YjiS (DUF1127 family)